jgi:Rrf2 family protein
MIELAAEGNESAPVKGDQIADAQAIPLRFLENILAELRHAALVHSRRGADGGYWLARPGDDITLAEIIRAVEGPLATVRGAPPDELVFEGDARPLREVWIALRANIREILESVTLADVVAGELPEPVRAIADDPDVWLPR